MAIWGGAPSSRRAPSRKDVSPVEAGRAQAMLDLGPASACSPLPDPRRGALSSDSDYEASGSPEVTTPARKATSRKDMSVAQARSACDPCLGSSAGCSMGSGPAELHIPGSDVFFSCRGRAD